MVETASAPRHASVDFQGRDAQERFQFYFRQHWFRMLWPFTRTLLATIAVGLAAWITFGYIGLEDPSARQFTIVFLLLCLFLFQFLFLIRFYRHFLNITIVTDRRVHRIKKTLLTTDEHQSIDLWVLQDIHKYQRGVFQNMLGFGTLRLEAQDTHMNIHFTPRINECYKELVRVLEGARGRVTE